jgi:uncharacterized membrane protein (DUF485 family)
MKELKYDWAAIAKNTKFIKLQRKKTVFLFSLWMLGSLPYLLLTIGAGYAPELFNARVFGRMNIGYMFCIFQFFWMIAIANYYAHRTNKDFDPLTKEFLDEIRTGGAL